MPDVATREEVDSLKKSVHDLTEMVKKGEGKLTENIMAAVKDAMVNHPGKTEPTTASVVYPTLAGGYADPHMRAQDVMKRMPKELVQECDDIFLLSLATGRRPNQLKAWKGFSEDLGDWKKALSSTAAGGIDEWVPTDFSNQFYELVRLQTSVASLFPTISMPSNPFTLPIQLGRLKTYKGAEQTADTGQDKFGLADSGVTLSDVRTLTAVLHNARILTSDESSEDAFLPVIPFIRAELIKAFAEGREDCILNGDTAGSHEDTDISTATDRRKMWLGLRAHANDNSYKTDLGTGVTTTALVTFRKSMGIYGTNPNDLAYITGISGLIKMLLLPEVITVDKFGPQATILTGQIANLGNVPVVLTGWTREVLDANGIYSASGTKTCLHLVYRRGFVIGEKRGLSSKLLDQVYAESGQQALVMKERLVFKDIYPIASNKITWMGYNFA